MESTASKHLAGVWIFLSGLTLLSWQLSAPQSDSMGLDVPVTIGVLAMAYLKCRFIMRSFMEVRNSARDLRLFSDIWLAAFFGTIAVIYVYGSGQLG